MERDFEEVENEEQDVFLRHTEVQRNTEDDSSSAALPTDRPVSVFLAVGWQGQTAVFDNENLCSSTAERDRSLWPIKTARHIETDEVPRGTRGNRVGKGQTECHPRRRNAMDDADDSKQGRWSIGSACVDDFFTRPEAMRYPQVAGEKLAGVPPTHVYDVLRRESGAENRTFLDQFPGPSDANEPVRESLDSFVRSGKGPQSNGVLGDKPETSTRKDNVLHDNGCAIVTQRGIDHDGYQRGVDSATSNFLETCNRKNADEIHITRSCPTTTSRGHASGFCESQQQFPQTTNVLDDVSSSRPRANMRKVKRQEATLLGRRRRTTIIARVQDTSPLHVKHVPKINWTAAQELIREHAPELQEIFVESIKYFLSGDAVRALGGLGRQGDTCFLSDEDIIILISAGLIVEVSTAKKSNCKTFTVSEISKNRRRWILHPIVLNDATEEDEWFWLIPDLDLFPSVEQVIEAVTDEAAVCFDFAAFFHSLPVSHDEFVFTGPKGRKYAAQTVPTGSRQAPLAAQILTKALARAAIKDAGVDQTKVRTHCWIDNVRFTGHAEILRVVAASFRRIVSSIDIVISEDSDITTQYTFLGIEFTHSGEATGSVRLSEKARTKLTEWINQCDEDVPISYLAIEKVLGVCLWGQQVIQPNSNYYYVIKFYRRKVHVFNQMFTSSAQGAMALEVTIWTDARNQWKQWATDLLATRLVKYQPENEHQLLLTTDASNSGFGGVLRSRYGVQVFFGKWSESELKHHINLKELIALRIGVLAFREQMKEADAVHLRVDNTTVIGRYNRLCPPKCFIASQELGKIKNILHGKQTTISYVQSACNEADFLSRLYQTPPTQSN